MPSISTENRALPETAAVVESLVVELGFETLRLEVEGAPPAVYGERRGRSMHTVLLYNHYDVQPVDPLELWESPPFEPTVRDGRLYARGAADNKGQIAARLAAVRSLLETEGELPVGIRWIIEGEEEVGSPHFDALAREHAALLEADSCLWEGSGFRSDGRPLIALGCKGILYLRLDARVLDTDGHSSVAGVVPSAGWRLLDALRSIRDEDGRVLVPGFYEAVRQPTEAEREAIEAQGDTVETDIKEAFGIEGFLDGLEGVPLRERLQFAPTCNLAGIHSGYTGTGMKTVLAAEATARLDFRLVPSQQPAEISAAVRSHLDERGFADVALTVLGSAEPVQTPIEHPLVGRVRAVAERFAGAPPAIVPLGPATLPLLSSLERHVGVPGLAAPDNPIYMGCKAHAPNEHIRLEDLGRAVEFTRTLLAALAD